MTLQNTDCAAAEPFLAWPELLGGCCIPLVGRCYAGRSTHRPADRYAVGSERAADKESFAERTHRCLPRAD